MSFSFDDAMRLEFRLEGGFSDDPDDPGGATKYGITQNTLNARRLELGQAQMSVRDLTRDEAKDIYYEYYWLAGKCPHLASPFNVMHFDGWINIDHLEANKILQRSVAVRDDGVIGPITLAAVASGASEQIQDYLWHRLRYYRIIAQRRPRLLKFLPIWMKRMAELRGFVERRAAI